MMRKISWRALWADQTTQAAFDPDRTSKASRCCQQSRTDIRRRAVLGGLLGWIFSPLWLRSKAARAATDDPTKMRVQPGDQLVFKSGERKGKVIALADVVEGAKQVVGYPYDPVNDVLRKGTRLNQILLIRLPEDEYTDEVRARAVDGVIAYSAICTHQNCPVTAWHPDHQQFICPCHESHYDPKNGARVVSGPAKRALPALPLTVKDGVLIAAGGLTGKVGKRKPS